MKRAVVSPLLSALVLPGLGQAVNREPLKALVLVLAVSILLVTVLALGAVKFSAAANVVAARGELPPGADPWDLLAEEMLDQGLDWLLVCGAVFAALWIFSFLDAWCSGSRLDAAEAQEQQKKDLS